ncbi:MAG TPA: hypothetical protein DCS21_12310 [Gammaproteobacteria bacterium]|nr:hypothetical protein [Gammaproteobacteria bacterium]
MKLLIRRDVKGSSEKPTYALYARAQLTDAESMLIQTNRLGSALLLRFEGSTEGSGSMGALLRVMRNLTVKNLAEGTTFSGDHIGQLRDIEMHVIQAAKNLKRDLMTAQTLGSETLIDIDAALREEREGH